MDDEEVGHRRALHIGTAIVTPNGKVAAALVVSGPSCASAAKKVLMLQEPYVLPPMRYRVNSLEMASLFRNYTEPLPSRTASKSAVLRPYPLRSAETARGTPDLILRDGNFRCQKKVLTTYPGR